MLYSHIFVSYLDFRRFLLLASHCLAGQTTNTLEIMVGTNRIGVNTGGTFYKTEKITMHPGYNQPRFGSQVTLIPINTIQILSLIQFE